MVKRFAAVVLAFLVACGSDGGEEPKGREEIPGAASAPGGGQTNIGATETVIQIGDDVPAGVRERFVAHMNELAPGARVVPAKDDLSKLGAGSFVVAVGSTWATDQLVNSSTATLETRSARSRCSRSSAWASSTRSRRRRRRR